MVNIYCYKLLLILYNNLLYILIFVKFKKFFLNQNSKPFKRSSRVLRRTSLYDTIHFRKFLYDDTGIRIAVVQCVAKIAVYVARAVNRRSQLLIIMYSMRARVHDEKM